HTPSKRQLKYFKMNNEQDKTNEMYRRRYNNYENHIGYLKALRSEWRMKHRLGEPIIVEYYILRRLLQEAILRTRSLQNTLINNNNEKNENK
ncbi:MAG: hypothetical protein K2L37_05030, partial [Lactobacillus sp.]|nr:hypothetical protein [Lactobacillus sp.]